jgi:TRAP transporter TAXI family solute receptor
MDLGLASNIPVQSAVEKKVNLSPIRLMAMGSTSDIHWIVRKDSPIKSITDFRGYRVAVGAPGSGTLAATKWKLEAFGITFNDIKPAYLSYSESITALKDNTVDVGQITAGYPVASLLDLARYTPIRLISLSQEELKITLAKIPYYVEVTIPADVYPGVTTPVATLGSPAAFFCRDDLSDELVYKMMKAIYEHPKEIGAIHPQAAKWNLENAFRGAEFATRYVSFHKGAVKYFQEKGAWKEFR